MERVGLTDPLAGTTLGAIEDRSCCTAGAQCRPTASCAPRDLREKTSSAKTRCAKNLPAARMGPMVQRRAVAAHAVQVRTLVCRHCAQARCANHVPMMQAMMPDAETLPLCPRRPVPNEPTNCHNNATKLMERVKANPGLNNSGGYNVTTVQLPCID